MKKAIAIICLTFALSPVLAQTTNVDSLKQLLLNEKIDTTRIGIISKITIGYTEYNPDSTIVYANKLIAWGEKNNDLYHLHVGLSAVAYSMYNKGNYPSALDYSLNLLRILEKGKDTIMLADTYNLIGNIYKSLQSYPRAIVYYQYCKKAALSCGNKEYLTFAYFNLAYVYEYTNILDSALIYSKKALMYTNKLDEGVFNGYVLNIAGDVYFKLKNYKAAYQYYKQAYSATKKTRSLKKYTSIICISLSKYFRQANKLDLAFYYAYQALADANTAMYKKSVYESAGVLSSLYETDHQPDSAFKYLKLAGVARDSLYNNTNFQEIDALNQGEENRLKEIEDAKIAYKNDLKMYLLVFVLIIFLLAGLLLWRNNRNKQKAYSTLQIQKTATEQALQELKATQNQLVQREKMASLGELTAGIAHEIQNPLNFVNNFSEVSVELVDEMQLELNNGDKDEAIAISEDIKQNLEKIRHHGKRADFIVKGMLLHSRTSTGQKELTNINIMADEFFRLSYHGLRAKDKNFNAELITHFDKDLPEVNVAHQDIGRVLLNLFNNAFYAVNEKQKTAGANYRPEVSVSTSLEKNNLVIKVKDNGNGIPDAIKDKIMQPFFTTKPTGEGTGLGLSLSYDIVVKGHGGSITIDTREGEYSSFNITLPLS
jgi:two-component system NtrC family sensor kinase